MAQQLTERRVHGRTQKRNVCTRGFSEDQWSYRWVLADCKKTGPVAAIREGVHPILMLKQAFRGAYD